MGEIDGHEHKTTFAQTATCLTSFSGTQVCLASPPRTYSTDSSVNLNPSSTSDSGSMPRSVLISFPTKYPTA